MSRTRTGWNGHSLRSAPIRRARACRLPGPPVFFGCSGSSLEITATGADFALKGVATPFHGQRTDNRQTRKPQPAKPQKPDRSANRTQLAKLRSRQRTRKARKQRTQNSQLERGNIEVRPLKIPRSALQRIPRQLGARPHRWKSKRWNGTISQRSCLDSRLLSLPSSRAVRRNERRGGKCKPAALSRL